MPIRSLCYLLLAAIGYIVMPLDLIPDVPGIGWLDDMVVLGAVAYLLFGYLPKHGGVQWRRTADGARNPDAAAAGSEAEEGFKERFGSDDPYVVLGVTRAAGADDLKHAYRDLLTQYHPDKVAHLSPEFQALAHDRVVAIQRAYTRVAG